MSPFSRRDVLKAGLVVGAAAGVGSLSLKADAESATSWVTLGRSDLKVTRLAFGTGTNNGHVQSALGQKEFSRLVHYAYDRGIRFFETAESYSTPAMLGEALKPFPRDSYQIMNKVTTDEGVDPKARFEQMLQTSKTDYFDIMLLHYQHTDTWPEDTKNWQDAILEAQEKQTIRSRGASVHGLPALRQVPGNQWLQIAMIRMNQKGVRMDAANYATDGLGNVPEVVAHVQQVKKEGMGVISMKLVGEGSFISHEDRQASMRFAFHHAGVDAVTVGFKSTAEIDEAINNINLALA